MRGLVNQLLSKLTPYMICGLAYQFRDKYWQMVKLTFMTKKPALQLFGLDTTCTCKSANGVEFTQPSQRKICSSDVRD